jgi:hypothetical protein
MKILFLDCDGVLNDSNDMMVTGDIRPYYVLNYKKSIIFVILSQKPIAKLWYHLLGVSWKMA